MNRIAIISLVALANAVRAEPVNLTVSVNQPGARLNPRMWGIFFEDINFAGDGGLHAERVKNRSFEFANPIMGWGQIRRGSGRGTLAVLTNAPIHPNNPHYLRVEVGTGARAFGLANEGFRGMGLKAGDKYDFSVWARRVGDSKVRLRVELVSAGGRTLDRAELDGFGPEWKRHTATLRPSDTDARARLDVYFEGTGALDLDLVSLYPRDTWKERPCGLRADLVQLLADLKPGFVRFPGGCIVEGRTLPLRYQWKKTLGDPVERPTLINRWNDEFKHRPAPDYFQSFGLGFFEFFQLCEDLGAEPLPILNCGMACQFNSGELAPLEQLDPFIRDALDLIEFANGPDDSPWGRRRDALGHAKPFGLRWLGVGNEQWGPQYVERYARFARVLKARHPEIQLVASAGPDPDGEKFNFLWRELRGLNADLIDEHYYRPPAWFLDNTRRYDPYDRRGPKVFAGEYAAQSVRTVSPDNRNNLECALAEAAMMTGFERNGDVVRLTSYAPLFGHVEAWQWTPNLIWFDNLRACGTPSYYVQQMFSVNRGDLVLPVRLEGEPRAANRQPRFYASATRDAGAGEVILKVVNPTESPVETRIQLAGAQRVKSTGKAIVLTGASLGDENSLDEPWKVSPREQALSLDGARFAHVFPARSLTVLRLPAL